MEDYNNEIFLGNSYENSLSEIWNGGLYDKFRKDHQGSKKAGDIIITPKK